jgi:hypothetical protein
VRSPPPPFPPGVKDETDWTYAGVPAVSTFGDYSGHATAFYKHVATDVGMPADFQTHSTGYGCAGALTGAEQCARHCADEVGYALVAFQVTGKIAPPPPPSPTDPPLPPLSPPAPHPPYGFRFNGATDACKNAGVYTGNECRDGGVGSVFPPYCDYGSQVSYMLPLKPYPCILPTCLHTPALPHTGVCARAQYTNCGPRDFVANGAIIGDDSCPSLANNGDCEDGGGVLYPLEPASAPPVQRICR